MYKETDIQNQIRVELSRYGLVVRNQVGRFRTLDCKMYVDMGVPNGFPDLTFIRDGKIIGFEIKTKKGRQSKDQQRMQEIFNNLNTPYHVVRSSDEALQVVFEYFGDLKMREVKK